jgi:membrane-associated phospholipid phosphatase
MGKSLITSFAAYFTNLYPLAMVLGFLGTLFVMKIPDKGAFLARAVVALVVAVFLAHVNRIFHLYPRHLLFPSGHTTLCFGLALSFGMLRPWTLLVTLPLLVVLGISMVCLKYHTTIDILGAIPLVLVIYGIVHCTWRLPSDSPLLDRARVST